MSFECRCYAALLKKKADVGARDKHGCTPLHMAPSTAAAFQDLIVYGAWIHSNVYQRTAVRLFILWTELGELERKLYLYARNDLRIIVPRPLQRPGRPKLMSFCPFGQGYPENNLL